MGAAVAAMDSAWWVTSITPGRAAVQAPGTCRSPSDPGRRQGRALHRRVRLLQDHGQRHVPPTRRRRRRRLGDHGEPAPRALSFGAGAMGGPRPEWLSSGYMKKADSIEGLAGPAAWRLRSCGGPSSGSTSWPGGARPRLQARRRPLRPGIRRSHGEAQSLPGRAGEAALLRGESIRATSAPSAGCSPTSTPGCCARTARRSGLYATGNSTARDGRCYPAPGPASPRPSSSATSPPTTPAASTPRDRPAKTPRPAAARARPVAAPGRTGPAAAIWNPIAW